MWKYPDVPDTIRQVESTNGHVSITSLGFGTPHPSRPHSAALQRQVSLLEGDRQADYFLFDDADRPIRFALYETYSKMCFRMIRADAMFGERPTGVEALVQYLIKTMSDRPGLSRARIVAQFQREYGGNMAAKLREFEAKGPSNGDGPGVTFLESMSRSMMTMMDERF